MFIFGCVESGKTIAETTVVASTQVPVQNLPVQTAQPKTTDETATMSAEAQSTFAYLLYSQAILDNDENLLLEAGKLLKESRAPAKIWMEAGAWLMGKKSPKAIPILEQALALWPDDLSLHLLYAEALMEHGQTERGIQITEAYLRKHPDSIDARLELALLQVKNKDFVAAENLLKGIREEERSPMVNYYHARALIGMGRINEAIARLRKALQENPDFVEALAELGYLYEKTEALNEAAIIYDKLFNLNFPSNDVLLKLINIHLRLKKPEKAIFYAQAGSDDVHFQMVVAQMFMEAGYYLQAESILKKLVAQGYAPGEVYLVLADLTYEQRHNLELALDWLDRMPKNSQNSHKAQLLRAQLLAEAGKEDEALKIILQGQKQFPDISDFWEFETRLLAQQKKMKAALQSARTAVKMWPEDTGLAFLLGSLCDETGDKAGAFAIMEKILTKQPENYQALNYVGYTLAEENREIERAVQLLQKANELSPNQAYIVDSLAWALYKAGRLEDALKEIRRAVSLEKKPDAAIWEHYGDIADKAGYKEEARKAYRKALELKPDNATVLRERLSKL